MALVLALLSLLGVLASTGLAEAAAPDACRHIAAGRAAYFPGGLSLHGILPLRVEAVSEYEADESLECLKALMARGRLIYIEGSAARRLEPLPFGKKKTVIEVRFLKYLDERPTGRPNATGISLAGPIFSDIAGWRSCST